MLKLALALILLGDILVNFTDASCVQNNITYDEGDTWHPFLHPYGVWRCANCSCISGEIKCVKEHCPPVTCDEPRIPRGDCCPICDDFTNLPPTVTTDTNNETGKGRRGCSFQGNHYADGAVFSSNSTGISPTMESQCVNCNCLSGRVLCRLKTCDIPRNCRKLSHSKDDCCPKCADCRTVDELHLNGSEWRPSIGRNCITCTCLNGEMDCNRVDCAAERITCTAQKQSRGECCNRCMRNKNKNRKRNRSRNRNCKSRKKKNRKRGRKKNGRRRSKDKKGRRKDKRRRRKHRKQNNTQSAINGVSPSSNSAVTPVTLPVIFKTSPGNPLPAEYFTRLCKPDDTDKVIYRQFIKHHGIYIAFDDLVADQIEVLWWNLTKGKLSPMQKYKYPADEFRQNITEKDVIGAASNGEIKTFKRRLKKQMDTCLKRNKCRSKLIKRAFSCFEIEKVTPYCQAGSS